jgi:phosphohistidine phosphatase
VGSNSLELYLLRHGIAEDRAPSGRDADRALTDAGKHKLEKVLKRAHKAGVHPTLIVSSPYKRAMETAEIAARELEYNSEIVRSDRLTPNSSPPDLWSEIRAHRDEPSILLAGHEPLFSATVAYLLGSTRAMVEFRKGALVRIDFSTIGAEPRGVLQWMLTPKLS